MIQCAESAGFGNPAGSTTSETHRASGSTEAHKCKLIWADIPMVPAMCYAVYSQEGRPSEVPRVHTEKSHEMHYQGNIV